MSKKVYLCGAMEGLSREEACGWRELATAFFNQNGIEVLDPCRRLSFHTQPYSLKLAQQIVTLDLYDIADCDLVLANLAARGKGKAWGSVMELVEAYHEQKGVVTVLEDGFTHPFISVYSDEIYGTLQPALEACLDRLSKGATSGS